MLEPIAIERKKLFEIVAEHIEGLILSGKLQPGDQLPPERELQAAFGVGRPAVREALITLERNGLIEIGNGVPARVSQPSAEGLLSSMMSGAKHLLSTPEGKRQGQDIRRFIEAALARKAARQATPQQLEELEAALLANLAARNDVEAFAETDVAFHLVIARLADEPAILVFHQTLSDWLAEQRLVSLQQAGALDMAIRHHERIFAAIRDGDGDGAETAMHDHLTDVQTLYWEIMSTETR
ncbi:MAG: FCD domain-containing protein [Lautropia sp.]|nr:FCD domain-containing protein [Lautropia sp.]